LIGETLEFWQQNVIAKKPAICSLREGAFSPAMLSIERNRAGQYPFAIVIILKL
jgi:hypothetical protein